MSLPIWFTGGERRDADDPQVHGLAGGSPSAAAASKICTGTTSPNSAAMLSRVSWPTAISSSVRGGRPRRRVGVSSPFTGDAASPGTA